MTVRADPRRIDLVIHSFDRGGSGRVAGHLARGWSDRGLLVEMIVLAKGGEVEADVERMVGPDVPIRHLGRSSGLRPLDMAVRLPALARRLRAGRAARVVAAANNVALVTAAAHRLAGIEGSRLFLKTTNPVASSRHRGLVRRIRLAGYAAAFRWTDRVLTLSEDENDEMVAAFPRHADLFRAVANPYVTADMLRPPTADRRRTGGPATVVCVARLARQKRLERLVAAFAHVRTDARLLILGEGEERGALAALVAGLGLQERISMPGHSPDVPGALHAADLFVLTSDYEGLPAVVLEAMAAGCPVLSTPSFPAARTLLRPEIGCGILEDTDPRHIAAAIDAALGRPRGTAMRDVAERYTIANGVLSHLDAMA